MISRWAAESIDVSSGWMSEPALSMLYAHCKLIGMVFSFADAAGGELPGVVDAFDEDTVRVNFNHPLAGRTLRFEVKIDRVEPAELH